MPKDFFVQLVGYILIYPILFLTSLLPFRFLYIVSDCVFVIMYYVVGYRKKVVTQNLKLVFPEKTEAEILSIRQNFYRHMVDMFLEMIKSITISEKQLIKRFHIKNPEELQRLEGLDKSVVVLYGHYASYEWSVVVGHYLDYKGYAIYKPIKNKNFDNLVKRMRSKYNVSLISSKEAVSKILESEAQNIRSVTAFLSDQSPKSPIKQHWIEFMGVMVPCFTGGEYLAKRLDLSVSFLKISKVKRGFYEAEFVPLADDPNELPNYEITAAFTRALESQIREAPEYYLWSHKRWKHRLKAQDAHSA